MQHTIRAGRVAAGLLASVAILAACARPAAPSSTAGPTDPGSSDRPAPSTRLLQTPPASTAAVVGEVPAEVLDPILADAAEQAGLTVAEIVIVQAEQVTWPDGSLGCPEPGSMYTQALVDGYHVVLDAAGEELDYRIGSGGSFRLCEGSLPRGG